MSLSKEQMAEIITDVALRVGADPNELDALINFETGGTYSPTIKNKLSSARGLIQIIDGTAQDYFGMTSEALVSKFNTFQTQMYGVVLPYLKRKMPFPTQQSLFMAVFYPKYREVSPDTVFPAAVQRVNPGIVRVSDYINHVLARVKRAYLVVPLPKLAIPGLLVLVGIAYWQRKRLKQLFKM